MKLTRRKMLALTGTAVGGAGAIGGSGAFDTVQANRTVSLQTTGDASAGLGLEGVDSEITGTETVNGNSVLKLESTKLSENATTEFVDAVRISNNGTDDVTVHIDGSSLQVSGNQILDFVVDGSSIIGSSNSVDLDTGNNVLVDVVVDIRGSSVDGSDLSSISEITFVANKN